MKKKIFIIGAVLLLILISLFLIYKMTRVDISGNIAKIKADEASLLLRRSDTSYAKGDEDGAIKDLETLILKYPSSPQAELAFFNLGSIYEKRGNLLKAKDIYKEIIERFPSSANIARAQEGLENLNMKILFSPIITPDSLSYEVQKGDSLSRIAKKFNTTAELIARSNNIKDGTVRIGRTLKVTKAKFGIVVDKSQHILTLKADGNIFKTYKVSTGINNSTPSGNFRINSKVVNPTWYTAGAVIPPGSPKNILGSRWLGINKEGYGIHGTTDPKSIGKNVTAGCIRMRNQDVEELYMIVPEGTEVIIVD